MVAIRDERTQDAAEVRLVNAQAFEDSSEADLVAALRDSCPGALSLVAEEAGRVVGHILLTPVTIEAGPHSVTGMGLGPMAVVPDRQRQGIGSALVRHSLDFLQGRGCLFVVVLGHPDYYPRFGFEPASRYRITSQWDGVPDEAFMIRVLDPSALEGVAGLARYRSEFDEVTD